MTHMVTDRIAAIVHDYLVANALVNDTAFEVTLMPSQDSVPMVVIFFWLPSPVLGKRAVGSIAIREDPSIVSPEVIHASLIEFLAKMRAAQSERLSAVSSVPPRGSQTASGILVP